MKVNGFKLAKERSRRYPTQTITRGLHRWHSASGKYTKIKAEILLHSLERPAAGIVLYVNAHKTDYVCINNRGNISTLPRKRCFINWERHQLAKAWTAIDRLSVIWKSVLTDNNKTLCFPSSLSIMLNGCSTWTLTKRTEKKFDGNYTRMPQAILNKSWKQHPTRQLLYGYLLSITKTIQVRRTRHARYCWRKKGELKSDILLWTPSHGRTKTERPARTYVQQLCTDTWYSLEGLPGTMDIRDRWQERAREIRTSSVTWRWWWWWFISNASIFKVISLPYNCDHRITITTS